MDGMLQKLGIEEGEAIVHPGQQGLEKAQGKVEARNFDIRKQLLQFDDVMNDQRKVIYEQRKDLMEVEDVSETIKSTCATKCSTIWSPRTIPPKAYAEQWDIKGLHDQVLRYFGRDLPVADWAREEGADDETIRERLYAETDRIFAQKVSEMGPDTARQIEKAVLLQTIDMQWREHLITLDHLRSVIGLRGYGQRDPLNEYKSEAFSLFGALLSKLRFEVTGQLAHVRLAPPQPAPPPEPVAVREVALAGGAMGDAPPAPKVDPANPDTWGKVGRNDLCPCGSGKKFKHCHGRL
jgi:preprotein translocase subunit SecA